MTDKREAKEEMLRCFVESSRQALYGLSQTGLQESREMLNKLTQVGRLNQSEASSLENQLVSLMEQKRSYFDVQIQGVIQTALLRLKAITGDEMVNLEKRLTQLEGRVKRQPAPSKSL
jgi:polyhydroxyalkanoate synthesis regulator phasin